VAVVVPEQCGLGESTYWANISFVDPSFVFILFCIVEREIERERERVSEGRESN